MLDAIYSIHYIYATAKMPVICTIYSMCTLHTTFTTDTIYIIYNTYIPKKLTQISSSKLLPP